MTWVRRVTPPFVIPLLIAWSLAVSGLWFLAGEALAAMLGRNSGYGLYLVLQFGVPVLFLAYWWRNRPPPSGAEDREQPG